MNRHPGPGVEATGADQMLAPVWHRLAVWPRHAVFVADPEPRRRVTGDAVALDVERPPVVTVVAQQLLFRLRLLREANGIDREMLFVFRLRGHAHARECWRPRRF